MSKIAQKSDWKTEPMPAQNAKFQLKRHFTKEQMAALVKGNVPQEMEDKWFWYYEDGKLYAHRSWTGFCIYIIAFDCTTDVHNITVNRNPEQYTCTDIADDVASLNHLLDWWTQPTYDYYHEWLSETVNNLMKQNALTTDADQVSAAVSNITLLNASCADQTVDAVVNAANSGLWAGGGICGVIFKRAGLAALTAACKQYKTPLKDGSAVITPAFQMTNAKYIIHAVGPDFGRTPKAFKELFDAYYNSLCVLKNNDLHSISFPLISSGIFGGALSNPAAESTKQCCRAYLKFVADYPDYPVDVKLCAFSAKEMQDAKPVFDSVITA